MRVVGIDPGVSTGFFTADFEDGILKPFAVDVTRSQAEAEKMFRTLAETVKPDVWVIEDYVINPKNSKGHVYSHRHTNDLGVPLRLIGSATAEAQRQGAKVQMQLATAKPAGYGWMGKKYVRGKKEQHALDAKAHVVYYLVTKHGMHPLQSS